MPPLHAQFFAHSPVDIHLHLWGNVELLDETDPYKPKTFYDLSDKKGSFTRNAPLGSD